MTLRGTAAWWRNQQIIDANQGFTQSCTALTEYREGS
jgi:hypothetical protein